MSGGTVNLSRDFWDDEAFRDEPFTQREAFLWFITEASWKDRTRRVGDSVVHLKRGELAASVRFMAKRWGWTPAKVQRFLEKLKISEKICLKIDTGLTVISVCKYGEYQNKPGRTDTRPIQDRYTTDTNENKGEIRGKEKKDNAGASAPRVSLKRWDEFWAGYPQGDYSANKDACRKKYLKAVKAGATEAQIISAVRAYSQSPNVAKGFVKNPGNWLSDRAWENHRPTPPVSSDIPDEELRQIEARALADAERRKAARAPGLSYEVGHV